MKVDGHELKSYLEVSEPQSFKGTDSMLYQCPRCMGHKKLEVNVRRRLWFCHKCQEGGSLDRCRKQPGSRVMRRGKAAFIPLGEEDMGTPHWKYLHDRVGDDLRIRDELRPHYGPDVYRVYLPVFDLGNREPVYFVGRSVHGQVTPSYMDPADWMCEKRKSEVVWGLHRMTGPVEMLIVCEGIFDALWGRNRVALLGKKPTPQQCRKVMSMAIREIIMYLDGDAKEDAIAAAVRLVEQGWHGRLSMIRLAHGVDPDDLRGNDGYLIARRTLLA